MARVIKPLTATQVSNAKAKEKLYKLFDGGGLFLQVNPSGGKHWKLKYRKLDGKESVLTFGAYPALSLEQARKKRDEAKSLLVQDIDPVLVKQAEKEAKRTKALNTFEYVACEWLEVHSSKAEPITLKKYQRILEKYIYPQIGNRPVFDLKAPDFLQVLRKIEALNLFHTTKRARIVCGMVMRYAVVTGRAESDQISSLRGAIKSHLTKHLASTVTPKEVGRLLRLINSCNVGIVVATALKISPYLFVRPGELRNAQWCDINFDTKEWQYMVNKTKTPHIVPLAPQVIELLKELHKFTGNGRLVFAGRDNCDKPMSSTNLLRALQKTGIKQHEMTPHGFRAMARTMLDEQLGERYDLIEMQLAHKVRDPNGRAYNRTQHLAERHRMMVRWADYLDKLRDEVE